MAAALPTQREINEKEWQNPNNWSGFAINPAYFSKRDSRLFVPMSRLGFGSVKTINFGHRWGLMVFSLMHAVLMMIALLIAVR